MHPAPIRVSASQTTTLSRLQRAPLRQGPHLQGFTAAVSERGNVSSLGLAPA